MRKIISFILIVFLLACCLCACSEGTVRSDTDSADRSDPDSKLKISSERKEIELKEYYSEQTKIQDVTNDPAFGDYGMQMNFRSIRTAIPCGAATLASISRWPASVTCSII